jgi:RNA ligase (TIGR02306 family)
MPLATIQKAVELKPISGADAIECATVLGWEVVVKKGEFKPGDLGVYVEIDSLLPELPCFEFMRTRNFRVKTVKLRGQISQGLFMPLSILPGGEYVEGQDVTELLGVKKYEKAVPGQLSGIAKGNFPSFIPKTDEVRIQSEPHLLEEVRSLPMYATVKCDGSSATYYVKDGEFGVCGRNWELKEDENNSFWKFAREVDLENKMKSLTRSNIALQGEICGPGIQKNPMGLDKVTVFFFNLYLIDEHRYGDYEELVKVSDSLGLKTVPLVFWGASLNEVFGKEDWGMEDLVKYAEGTYPNGKPREGIVIRPVKEQDSQRTRIGRLSFKVVNNIYLLKVEE